MELLLTIAGPNDGAPDAEVLIDAGGETTIGDLTDAIARALNIDAAGLWFGPDRLPTGSALRDTALRDGCVVTLHAPAAAASVEPNRGLFLDVVAGPDAGMSMPLTRGDNHIGRSANLPLTDPSVSRFHATVVVTDSGVVVRDTASANGTTLDGETLPIAGAALSMGHMIRVGNSLLTLSQATPSDAALESGDDGHVAVNRPPRIRPPEAGVSIAFPDLPRPVEPRPMSWITILTPLLLGGAMALVLHQLIFLMFTLMSPVMAIATLLSDRRNNRRNARDAEAAYAVDKALAEQRCAEALLIEAAGRRDQHPDVAALIRIARVPSRRLWERRHIDDDFLSLRVGTADRPARLRVSDRGADSAVHPNLRNVPVTVDLRAVGVLGVAGPKALTDGVVRALMLQLAILHSPRDLSLTVLTTGADDRQRQWNLLRWLPHARSPDGGSTSVRVGTDMETTTARIAETAYLIDQRRFAIADRRVNRDDFASLVVILDGARSLRRLPHVAEILADGPALGVFAICIESDVRLLPEECRATVVASAADPGFVAVDVDGQPRVDQVLAEPVGVEPSVAVARALAPLRDTGRASAESAVPNQARLLTIVDLETPNPTDIARRWRSGPSLTVPLGLGSDGVQYVDFQRDGPHGLIAGTTGSGKSELLQTIIASLAMANSPAELNFVMIDYKGGSAFKDCARLPHTAGMVTDLDGHLAQRALMSFEAELKRRERLLADHGATDLAAYLELRQTDSAVQPMPRLFLIIDEFASLTRELPDFVSGLVGVAQRGRSLGIHLLLATQRPSGVVSPEIRANTNLRICLRVTDPAESTDVVGIADAALIPRELPGRALIRLGHDAVLSVQTARVSGRRPTDSSLTEAPASVVVQPWHSLGRPRRRPAETGGGEPVDTDLWVFTEAVRSAAFELGIDRPRAPWLQPLPEALSIGDLPDLGGPELLRIPIGLTDLPQQQSRSPLTFDLGRDGHLLLAGGPGSGRSQALVTLVTTGSSRLPCSQLHIFGIDCGNGALLPVEKLSNAGAIATRSQTDRVERLMAGLLAELSARQQEPDTSATDRIGGRHASNHRDAHIVLAIDGWEGFLAAFGEVGNGQVVDAVTTLLREGGTAGMHVVISGDRALATSRIASLSDRRLMLRMTDRGDYAVWGLSPRAMPRCVPPGRAFEADTGVESQIALLGHDPSPSARADAIETVAAMTAARDRTVAPRHRPFRVDELPRHVTFDEAWQLRPRDDPRLLAITGVGGDELTAVGADLGSTPAFVVAGPSRCGRSTVLVSMAISLLRQGSAIAIASPRTSPLRDLAGTPGVLAVVTDPIATADKWLRILGGAGGGSCVVIVDDGELLRDSPAGEVMRDIARGGISNRSLVLAGHTDGICSGLSGWQVEVKKSRRGLLLSPHSIADGDLVGVRLPRSAVTAAVTPGRGLLHVGDGKLRLITTPTLDQRAATLNEHRAPRVA